MTKIFEKVDAIIIVNTSIQDENFFYYTGLSGLWENSFAIIYPEKTEVIAPPLNEGKVNHYQNKRDMERLLKKFLNVEKIGFNGARLPYSQFRYLKKLLGKKLSDISKDLIEARALKSQNEINKIKKSCRISLKIIDKLKFENETENHLAINIEQKMKKMKSIPAFDTIVAFGKNTAFPHHIPSNKKFSRPALIDLGARYEGYVSDITRTYVSRNGKKVYEIVENILAMVIDEMRDGSDAQDIYNIAEKTCRKHGYSLIHALGHSIGVSVHDGYPITKHAEFVFKENMVFAIEPAIYLKNYGIRIEEDVIIKKNRAEIIR